MKLYQYQPISKYTLQNLILKKIWASNPKFFNDPFEFAVRDNYRITDDGKVQPFSYEEKKFVAQIKAEIDNFGVTCFSEREDILLLWSHYSSNHTGMCLTFDIKDPKPVNLFKVNYDKSFPDIRDYENNDFLKYLTTKGESWKYEQEHRLIFNEGVGHYQFPGQLVEITLGCKASNADIETLFEICDSIYDNQILLSKTEIDLNSFQLSIGTTFRKKGDPVPKYWINK
jgi:hypothetical protein